MKVLKFGGTSMADAEAWKQVLDIISNSTPSVTIVSATSKTTNALLEAAELAKKGEHAKASEISHNLKEKHYQIIDEFLAKFGNQDAERLNKEARQWIDRQIKSLDHYLLGVHTLNELSLKSIDAISSIGEQISSNLLALCGQAMGLKTMYVNAADIVFTNDDHGRAQPHFPSIRQNAKELYTFLQQGQIPIMGGFFGLGESGAITTLGRGGSDYSASIVGLCMEAESIEIWTDVSGMFTSDPRFISGTANIPEITFKEAAELAYFGAKILHPATIQPAVEKNIPVYIKNTFDPEHPGTKISGQALQTADMRAIAFKRDIIIITVSSSRMLMAYGFLAKVFSTFEAHSVSVDLVTTSEVSISMSVDSDKNLDLIVSELRGFGEVNITRNQTLICLVGRNFLTSKGVASQVFQALKEVPVRMISQGSSDINLSVVVDNQSAIDAVQKLHETFFAGVLIAT